MFTYIWLFRPCTCLRIYDCL